MRRRRSGEQIEMHDSNERWLVSYADFITLLFAFFVVMYAISSVNESKYSVLSDSLVSAFKSKPTQTLLVAESNLYPAIIELPVNSEAPITIQPSEKKIIQQKKMKRMAKDIMHALGSLVQDGKVRVTQSPHGITVEINASVLFSPAQALLAESSKETLRAVAEVVRGHEHEMHVEGHTDNLPISTSQYPSNWELSTARASSVVRLFINNGVDARRLTALGYGENRPVALNNTSDDRARNRRVTIMIMSLEPEQVTELSIEAKSD